MSDYDVLDHLNQENTQEIVAVYLTPRDNETVEVNVAYVAQNKRNVNMLLLLAQQQIRDKLAKKENDV